MAFNTAPAVPGNNAADDKWKAAAFLNIYLPTADGQGKTKVGAIPLKTTRQFEKALIERLTAEPELVEKMAELLIVDFQLADQPLKPGALPF